MLLETRSRIKVNTDGMTFKVLGVTTGEMDRRKTRPRVYFFPKGENIMDNLMKRHCRPEHEYKLLLPEVFEKLGIEKSTKAIWSQKAGCGCGCSPGFVLDGTSFDQDVFVDVSEKELSF